MKSVKIVLSCLLGISLLACEKKKKLEVEVPELVTTDIEPGMPGTNKVNGYFYAGLNSYSNNNYFMDLYGIFNDPAVNVMSTYNHYSNQFTFNTQVGNVSVGNVSFGTNSMFPSNLGASAIIYQRSNIFIPNLTAPQANWKMEGNGSFRAFDQQIARGFPTINATSVPSTISLQKDYTLTVGGGVVTNYDSLIVLLSDGSGFKAIIKRFGGGQASTVTFSKSEISIFSDLVGTSLIQTIQACNYSHRTIENKVYVFELDNKADNSISVTP